VLISVSVSRLSEAGGVDSRVGAAVEKKMANEIWSQLENGLLGNVANLNEPNQVASVSRWLGKL
jgi:restriction endonuclease BsobI